MLFIRPRHSWSVAPLGSFNHCRRIVSAKERSAVCWSSPANTRTLLHTVAPSPSEKIPLNDASQSAAQTRVAVLFQDLEPPTINNVRKPKKPGGYQDSGADIAYALQGLHDIDVLAPVSSPDPRHQRDWCFPDNEDGILAALQKGANYLWANTILFASHPLQSSARVAEFQHRVRVVGQPPLLAELFDDKEYVNNLLRAEGSFTLPRSITVDLTTDLKSLLAQWGVPYPLVGKPIRGRGSYGVKVCHSEMELYEHTQQLFRDSPAVMIEEYLSGEEGTITVMPPSSNRPDYWAMPIVTRFNHDGGIAPYSGVVAVTANSRVISPEEFRADSRYGEAARQCEAVARTLQVKAPVRVDIRRFNEDRESKFALFDVNMKPNMTGPGRPGRENQASLTMLAAGALGWDYPKLLKCLLGSACTLGEFRGAKFGNQ